MSDLSLLANKIVVIITIIIIAMMTMIMKTKFSIAPTQPLFQGKFNSREVSSSVLRSARRSPEVGAWILNVPAKIAIFPRTPICVL